jgi:hypothetical protein
MSFKRCAYRNTAPLSTAHFLLANDDPYIQVSEDIMVTIKKETIGTVGLPQLQEMIEQSIGFKISNLEISVQTIGDPAEGKVTIKQATFMINEDQKVTPT